METKVSSAKKEIIIGYDRPTVLIGERINPTGKKKLAAALQTGDMAFICQEALAQVKAGADILDVNVGSSGIDEVSLLPQAVQAVMNTVDVPLCLDSANPKALEAALKIYRGKPIVNSVNGTERSLTEILPLVKEYGTAVIGLTIDNEGIPKSPERRLIIARKILERAEALGISRQDVIVDCLAMTLGSDSVAGLVVIEAVRMVKTELGVNQTIGAGNISFGMPDRNLLTGTFLAISVVAGVNCPILDAGKVRSAILATDLILNRDKYAKRYIADYRQRQK